MPNLGGGGEVRQTINRFSCNSREPFSCEATLRDRIAAALSERGKRVSVVAAGEKISGEDLRKRATVLSSIIQARGILAGDTVGVFVDRSVESVVAIVAILESGCAYLPLDITSPEPWVRQLMTAARARLLVFQERDRDVATRHSELPPLGILSAATSASPLPQRKGAAGTDHQGSRLAYVVGTSGTTGKPKAVPIRDSSLLHYCDAFAARVGGRDALSGLRMASATTLAADLGNTMVFPSLLYGGILHLMPAETTRDPRRFEDYVREHRIDALKVVPTHLRALLERGAGVLPSKLLVVGGEPFGLDLVERLEALAPPCAVFNHYGPTEATVGVAMYPVDTTAGAAARLRARECRTVPIGTALGSNLLRVVDERLTPCPDGQLGELVVSGPSVSDGYLGPAEQSSRQFLGADMAVGGHAYRTGDLARTLSNGEIELFGRADRQFKVRGHRVEAVGVEEELRAHAGVRDAVVDCRVQREMGPALVAWVDAAGVDEAGLRGFLVDRLPVPMVPARIVVMDRLPRTANGKIDRAALPDPSAVPLLEHPRSVEEAVRFVFAQVLSLPAAAPDDNFFRIGGHSLAALQVIARLRHDFGLAVAVDEFYADSTPAGVARAAHSVGLGGPPVVARANVQQIAPQVHALWAHLRLNQHDAAYEVPIRLRVRGPVTPQQVRLALEEFVTRHESLRTRYRVNESVPVPVLDADASKVLVLAGEEAEPLAGCLDVENGPLVRATVSAVEHGECIVDLLIHHIAFDGVSGTVLARELGAVLGGQALPPTQVARSNARPAPASRPLGDGARARYGLSPAPIGEGASRCHERLLPEDLWQRVEARAAALNTTPFAVAAAAWALVLSRQDGEPAVTIGTPVDLRDPATEERLVGYHTNVVVIEVEVSPGDAIRDLILRAHGAVGRALADRYRPYAALVADQRAATGTPPTRTLLSVERLERAECAGVSIRQEAVVRARATFDVDVGVVVSERYASLQIHSRAAVCAERRCLCLADQLTSVLEQFAADPETRAGDVRVLPPEWEGRVFEWSRGVPSPPAADWGPQALSRHAADPNAVALVWPGGEWSRARFAEAVAGTAQVLRERGLGPGHVLAIAIPPSPALAVAWHAAHAVGAAVLALDPVWPQFRRDDAATRAKADVRAHSPDGLSVAVTGAAQTVTQHPPDLAYLILTSGSTGEPKLVAIQHAALANEFAWSAAEFPIDGRDAVLAASSPGFDVSVWELLGPLSWGARLVFPAVDRRNDVPHLAELVRDQRITVIQAVPSLLESLLGQLTDSPLRLRLLISGGEEMPPTLPSVVIRRVPSAVLVNTYGPSETAIDATFHRVEVPPQSGARVPLGKPIAGTRAYVLDERLRLLPPGAFGQLAIGGNSVGLGYLGDSAETARRFVPDPFATEPGARMYLTGDRARWNEDGLLEFGGRKDYQVKVRGNRVELEEVETVLRTLPSVRDAVVHFQDPGTARARLVALLVRDREGALTTHELHALCARLLPSYMTPSEFRFVDSLPRLASGKVARNALPLGVLDAPHLSTEWRTETERCVARVWADVLGRHDVDRDLPFFASGGTSLLVPILQLRLQEALGATLSVPELFEHATVWAQAAALDRSATGGGNAPAPTGRGVMRRRAYQGRRGGGQ
jgi:amino acid adenylation domain-containing protein